MKKLFCSLLSIVLCIGICTGCGGKKSVIASTGETTFTFTAEEFKKGFNKLEKDDARKIGEFKHQPTDFDDPTTIQFGDNYDFAYDDVKLALSIGSVESNKKAISINNMVFGSKNNEEVKQHWMQNNINILNYVDKSMTSEKIDQIMTDLGIVDEGNWTTSQRKDVVVDGFRYFFSVKNSSGNEGAKDYTFTASPDKIKK